MQFEFEYKMDIDRLNRIREICFKQSKSKTKKRAAGDAARSPFSSRRDGRTHTHNYDKENLSLESSQQIAIELKKQNVSVTRDVYKNMEKQVSEMYQIKQKRLDLNMQRYNERSKQRRRLRERQQNQGKYPYRSVSPLNGMSSRSPSPFKRVAFQSSPNPHERGHTANQLRAYSPLLQDLPADKTGATFRIRRIRDLLTRIVSFAGHPAHTLSSAQVEHINLRLSGAFDRLIAFSRQAQQSFALASTETTRDQLLHVIHGCLGDLEGKLKALVMGGPSMSDEEELGRVREFIARLTEQSAMIEIEEVLPKILAYLEQSKQRQACSMINSVFKRQTDRVRRAAWNAMTTLAVQKERQDRVLKMVFARNQSKAQLGDLTKSFTSWKDQTAVFRAINSQPFDSRAILSDFNEFFQNTIATDQIMSLSNFFDRAKEFFSRTIIQNESVLVDLVFVKGERQAVTFIQQQDAEIDPRERERILDLEQNSVLKAYVQTASKKKMQVTQSVSERTHFNPQVDTPFILRQSEFLKSQSQGFSQLFLGLFKAAPLEDAGLLPSEDSKKLKFVLRLTLTAGTPMEPLVQHLSQKVSLIESLLIQAFKVFRKLHYQFRGFTAKMEGVMRSGSDLQGMSQMSYLQQKSLELSWVGTIEECFKLINTVSKELYCYDKVAVLQYSQGSISRMTCKAIPNSEEEISLVEDQRCANLVRDLISGQILQTTTTNQSGVGEASQSQAFQQYVRQDLLEDPNTFDMSGKSLTDVVVISLDIKAPHSLIEMSTLYQLTTEHGPTGNTLLNPNQFMSSQTHHMRYFIRLEKKLGRTKEQESFTVKFDSFSVLKSYIQLMLISINKMRIIQQQREQNYQRLVEALQEKTLMQDSQVQEEYVKVQNQNEDLKRMLQIQRAIEEFVDELKETQRGQGMLYFEEVHMKMLGFLHVLIPRCKRMQMFLSKDPQGKVLYTYINQRNQAESPRSTGSQIGIVDQEAHGNQFFGSSMMMAREDRTNTKRNHHSQNSNKNVASRRSGSRNKNLYSSSQRGGAPTLRPQTGQMLFTNYQNVVVPSQLDDISSISPNDNTHIIGQDKNSGTSHYIGDQHARINGQLCPIARTQDNYPTAAPNFNPTRTATADPISRQASGLNLQTCSSASNLKLQAPHHLNVRNNSGSRHQSGFQLRRDYSAQTELNANAPHLTLMPTLAAHAHDPRGLPFQNLQDFVQQRTNSSETRGEAMGGVVHDSSSRSPSTIKLQQQFVQPGNNARSTSFLQGKQHLTTMLTSYDEIFHSHLQDDSDVAVDEFLLQQDPERIRRIEMLSAGSLIGMALLEPREGVMKRNAKKDKAYRREVDGLIYEGAAEDSERQPKAQRVLENVIVMPMISSKGQVVGVIQIANSEKQNAFSDQDLDIMRLFASKLGGFIADTRDLCAKQALFKKQMEASMLHQGLQSQTVKKVLSLANQLFQSDQCDPVGAVGYFVKKTEKYARQAFNCLYSQLLLIDHERQIITSFDVQGQQARLINRGDAFGDYSITNALIKGNFQDPIVWPGITENLPNASIVDDSNDINVGRLPQSHQNFYAQFLNPSLDCPATYPTQDAPTTYLSMTIRDPADPSTVLGILQLIQRTSDVRFTEHDLSHLQLLCQQLSQVLAHVFTHRLLTKLSKEQAEQVQGLVKVLSRRHKEHLRHFFRELLAFKYGKINLLKNKIMRKHMDRHMRIDQKLLSKVEKLAEIRDKCVMQQKGQAMATLRRKVQQINERRQRNAVKCVQIVNKYQRLLGIRVKDTVFRFWERLRTEGVSINHQRSEDGVSLSPTFYRGQSESMLGGDNSCSISTIHNQSSILDESSITSVLYVRAKAVYKMKKLFNRHALRTYFDTFVIKSLHQTHKYSATSLHSRRLFALKKILQKTIRDLNVRVFRAFFLNNRSRHMQIKTLHKVASKRAFRDMSFGLKQWQQYTEKSLKNEMRQDKTFISQLADQQKDGNLLQTMMTGINHMVNQGRNQIVSVEEFLQSVQMKAFLETIAEQVQEVLNLYRTNNQSQIVISIKLPDNYCLSECCPSQFLLFVQPESQVQEPMSIASPLRSLSPDQPPLFRRYHSDVNPWSSITEVPPSLTTIQQPHQQVVQPPRPLNVDHLSFLNVQPSQPSLLTLIDGSRDFILRQLHQTLASHAFTRDEVAMSLDELYINAALRARTVQAHHQYGYFLPMLLEPHSTLQSIGQSMNGIPTVVGSLEIYNREGLTPEEQARMKGVAQVLMTGFQSLNQQISLMHQLHVMHRQFLEQASNILQAPTIRRQTHSERILSLTNKVQRMMHADHALLLFTHTLTLEDDSVGDYPYRYALFFDAGQLFTFDLDAASYLGGSDQVLLHNSPVLTNDQRHYGTVKYLAVTEEVWLEVAWDQQMVGEQDEGLVRAVVEKEVEKMRREMKTFTRAIGRKAGEVVREGWFRPVFTRWKRNVHLPTLLSTTSKKEQNTPMRRGYLLDEPFGQSLAGVTTTERKKRALSQHYQRSPAFQAQHPRGRSYVPGSHYIMGSLSGGPVHPSQMRSPPGQRRLSLHKKSVSHGDESAQSRSRSASRMSGHEMTQAEVLLSEIDVEKAAKRKLVSASLIMIALQAKLNKRYLVKQALNEWKAFQNANCIAEQAFNKLLEINHRHSAARYSSASNLLLHVFKRHASRALFAALKSTSTRRTGRSSKGPQLAQSPPSSAAGHIMINNNNRMRSFQRLLMQSNTTGEPGSKQSQPGLGVCQEISYLDEPEIIQAGDNTTQQFEDEIISLGGRPAYREGGVDSEFSLAGTRNFEEEQKQNRRKGSKDQHSKPRTTYGMLMQDQGDDHYSSGNISSERNHRSLKPKPIAQTNDYQNVFKRY